MKVFDEKLDVLGSVIRITVVVDEHDFDDAETALQLAFTECRRFDQEYSRFRVDNQLSRFNAHLSEWQEVSPEFFFLLEQGLAISQKTDWAFDLGVKKLLEDWGYDANYSFQSPPHVVGDKEAVVDISYELVAPNKVKALKTIELGGLGKGYALDRMTDILKKFRNICIDAGGDLYAKGLNENGENWEIVFEHPTDPTMAIGKVSVNGFYMAASNPSKRRWKNYHHLVDPHSKEPAQHMAAVYTQAKTGLLADAYSTALFVLGFDRARELLPSLPVEAMIISPNNEIYRTLGFQGELF